jgi:hypothetical protein
MCILKNYVLLLTVIFLGCKKGSVSGPLPVDTQLAEPLKVHSTRIVKFQEFAGLQMQKTTSCKLVNMHRDTLNYHRIYMYLQTNNGTYLIPGNTFGGNAYNGYSLPGIPNSEIKISRTAGSSEDLKSIKIVMVNNGYLATLQSPPDFTNFTMVKAFFTLP